MPLTDDVTTISGMRIEVADFSLPAGTIVDERYEIASTIGQGGMCVVYEAKHLQLKRRCALKLLHLTALSSPESFERFKRESVLAGELKHPNIIEIFGFGLWKKRPYIAMEYLEGKTLTQLVDSDGPLPEERAVKILVQICDALQEAHAHHIVHRDLKPSNVIILNDDKVKLVDFGIARLLPESGEEVQKLTQTGQVLGSFFYMSPEQCMGKTVTERTDFYAFGCVMYKLLTGKTPFDGDSPFTVMGQHLGVAPPAMANVSQRLQDIAMWCMRKDPQERPASAADLREALLGDNQKVTRPLEKAAARAEFKLSSAGKVTLLTLALVAIVAACTGGYFYMRHAATTPAAVVFAPEEQRLLEDARIAKADVKAQKIAITADKLCQYYSQRNHWEDAEKWGYLAWKAANEAPEIPFDQQLWMTYRCAVAQQHNGKLDQAAYTFYRIADRWDDAPKDLKQLCSMHEAEACVSRGYIIRADRHFRKAMRFGTVGGLANLQTIRLEYAEFLIKHPEAMKMDGVNATFARDELTKEDMERTTETPEHLLRLVIDEGGTRPDQQKQVSMAKQMMNLLPPKKN